MRKSTITAILDLPAVLLEIPGLPGAMLQTVHRAVTEQTVEIRKTLVTREIFAILIFKKSI